MSDVTLIVNDRSFEVHKCILGARSPVFHAMFNVDMTEKQSNRVTLDDLDEDVMQELLIFIYGGKTPNLSRMATDLLAAADRFALDRLKVICEEALCSSLNVDTVCEVMVLADLHNARQLKKQAIEFINR